jgi:hypothetical protein
MSGADRLRRPVVIVAVLAVLASGAWSWSNRSSGSDNGGSGNGGGALVGGSPSGAGSTGAIAPPPTIAVVAPPAPTGPTVAVPSAIVRDCSVDVSDALNAWIASVPDNSTLAFPAHACYRADASIEIVDRNHLLLDGNGATLKAVSRGMRNRSELHVMGGSGITVRNLIVRGANPHAGATADAYVADLEAQHGFQVNGATGVLLDHVQAYDTYGDFVYIGPGKREPSRNVTVANSTFDRSGRQGISVTWATNVLIEANTIDDVARSVFDLEANTRKAQIRDVRIVGNVTGAGTNFWLANKGFAADIGNVQITGNRMVAGTGGLIFVYAKRGAFRGPYVVDGNRFIAEGVVTDEDAVGAFFFSWATNVTIHGNTVTFPAGKQMPAVEIRNSHHVSVTGNQFTNAGRTLVASQGSTDFQSS